MHPRTDKPTATTTPRQVLWLVAALTACSLPALLDPAVSGAMQDLYDSVDRSDPYLSLLDPVLQYLAMPLAVSGSIVLLMSPGLLSALALNQARDTGTWLLGGFAISLVLVSTTAALVQSATGSLTGYGFIVMTFLLTLAGGAILYARTARGARLHWPDPARDRAGYLIGVVVVPMLLLIALSPKFFWESFNGDGAHAYESARLLLHQSLPFWPPEAGKISLFPGMNSVLFTYPSSWFIRLFGPYEVSARLPFLLYLGLLHAAIVTTATAGLKQRLGLIGHVLVAMSVTSFALVMSYSATYDPYSADIALPATQDALLLVCFLCAVLGFLREQPGWMFIFIVFTLLSSPGAPPLLAGWLPAVLLAYRQRPWRMSGLYAGSLVAAIILLSLLPPLLSGLGLPAPGGEHSTGALLSKFDRLVLDDYGRFAFLLVPCGIYPLLALLNWRSAESAVRALILLTLGVFFMYYLIAYVSLHYFVAVMVLPVVFFWRQYAVQPWRSPRLMAVACLAAAGTSIALALPASSAIHTAARDIGETIDVGRLQGYGKMEAAAFRSSELLGTLFHSDSHHEVPDRSYGGSLLAWHYYAERATGGDSVKNYYLQPDGPPPEGTTLVAANETAALFVKDRELWESHQRLHPAGSQGPAIYTMSRDILFGRGNASRQHRIIHLKARLEKLFQPADR
jgi:hypothetical protein